MIPQALLDALNKLGSDSQDLSEKQADTVAKELAAAEASHAAEVARNAVAASKDQLINDKRALHELVDSTFPT